MPSANLQAVMGAFAAYAAGERAALHAVLHDDVEIVPLAPDLSGTDGPFVGHPGADQWLDGLGQTQREFTGDPDEVRESEDTVLVLGRVSARRPASGFAYTARVGWVIRLEDGLIRSFRGYVNPDEAVRAAGL